MKCKTVGLSEAFQKLFQNTTPLPKPPTMPVAVESRIVYLDCGCATFQNKPLILDINCKKHHPYHNQKKVSIVV